jgi:ParB/RepB/Spo0J family partition protein
MARTEPATRELAIELIDPSPTNTRQSMDEKRLAELADSIRQHGVLQPICVRPHPREADKFEVVFGHRRLEASILAGLRTIPAMVRQLDDRAALEAQVLENLAREDLPALEEAEGLRRLHEDHGYAVEDLAHRIGASKAYVYSRLQLCALPPRGREALARGELSLSAAVLVARIPNAKLREEAVKELTQRRFADSSEPVSASDARDLIEERFVRRLEGAPFDTTADNVTPGVGSCASCPRRTGNQRELFADAKSPDICTDPPCFREKVDAAWKRKVAEAKAAGRKVATPEETKKLFPYTHSNHVGDYAYVDLDDQNWESPKRKSWRQCLGKRAAEVAILVRDPSGEIREVAKKDQAIKLCRELGQEWAKTAPITRTEKSPAQKQADEKRKIALQAKRLAVAQLVETAEIGDLGATYEARIWYLVAELAIRGAWRDTRVAAATRRGLEFKGDPMPQLLEHARTQALGGARGIALELLATPGAFSASYGSKSVPAELEAALKHFAIDLEAIEAGVKAAAKASAKTKVKAKSARARRAAGAKTKASVSTVED